MRPSRRKDPKDLVRHPRLPPSTRNALFHTFIGIKYPDNIPPPYSPSTKDPPPIIDKVLQWSTEPTMSPADHFRQTIFRYHRLWATTFNEIEYGFNNEMYEASFIEGYFWSPMEKRRFFTALDKCGPHDPTAIQQRIGSTKTIYQVQLYINLLQEASEKHPITEDMSSTADNNNLSQFAYEMSSPWVEFEEQQSRHLSQVLDNESMSLDCYHRSLEKVPPPADLADAQRAVEEEIYMAQELIDPTPFYEWAARNPVDGIAPPAVTLETQTVMYRLVKDFVKGVMKNAILNRRRQQHRRWNTRTTDNSTKSEMTDDFDIGGSEIETVLRVYCDNDVETDMDMDKDIIQEIVDLDSDSDLDDDGHDLGFIVGNNSDIDSPATDTDTNSDMDSENDDNDSDTEMDSDSDESLYEGKSSDSDSDEDSSNTKITDGHAETMEQDLDIEVRLRQQDQLHEQGLYHYIVS